MLEHATMSFATDVALWRTSTKHRGLKKTLVDEDHEQVTKTARCIGSAENSAYTLYILGSLGFL